MMNATLIDTMRWSMTIGSTMNRYYIAHMHHHDDDEQSTRLYKTV